MADVDEKHEEVTIVEGNTTTKKVPRAAKGTKRPRSSAEKQIVDVACAQSLLETYKSGLSAKKFDDKVDFGAYLRIIAATHPREECRNVALQIIELEKCFGTAVAGAEAVINIISCY